jgi:hypothetical protein
MRARELASWLLWRAFIISSLYLGAHILPWLSDPHSRRLWGFDYPPFTWLDLIKKIINFIITGEL